MPGVRVAQGVHLAAPLAGLGMRAGHKHETYIVTCDTWFA